MGETPPSLRPTRRHVLASGVAAIGAISGCLSGDATDLSPEDPADRDSEATVNDGYGVGAYSISPYGDVRPT